MKTHRVYLIAALFVALSGGSLLLSASPATQAIADKDVVVTNTTANPVPVSVQGTAAVTGDVNIANTPTVNVANSPTVQLSNSAANPLLVRDVDKPGRHQFQQTFVVGTFGQFGINQSFSVPAGQIVVVQRASISGLLPENYSPELYLFCRDGSQTISHPLLMNKQFTEFNPTRQSNQTLWITGQQIECVADSQAGSLVIGLATHPGFSQDVDGLFWHLSVSGYTATP